MKVVTWNLNVWQSRSTQDEAWGYLRGTIKPDVALLQEVRAPTLMNREELVFRRTPAGWGTAIYSRDLPITEISLCGEHPGRVAGASVPLRNGEQLHLASIPAYSDRGFPP